MDIRKIDRNSGKREIEKYLGAYLRLFNDPQNLLFLSYTGIEFSRVLVSGWLEESGNSGVEYYTVWDQDEVVAILCIRYQPVETFEILSVVVDSGCRKRGLGGTLTETALKRAKELGFQAAEVRVFADNRDMLSLMIKNSFKPVKIEYHARYDGEDIVLLKKRIP